jgi:aryl-alcohol dehydrogenase-like predicted oxidoreductase
MMNAANPADAIDPETMPGRTWQVDDVAVFGGNQGRVAATHAKPGQIALTWLLNKSDDIVPIPGTKRRKFLEENVAAANLQLNPDQMKTLDEALAQGKISGKRYADWIMATIDR